MSIAAFLLLEQADLGLNDGLHANDLIIRKVIGTFDGDGKATSCSIRSRLKLRWVVMSALLSLWHCSPVLGCIACPTLHVT